MKKYMHIGMLAALFVGFFLFTGGLTNTKTKGVYTPPEITNVLLNNNSAMNGEAPSASVAPIYKQNEFRLETTLTSSEEKDGCHDEKHENYSCLSGTLTIKDGSTVVFSRSNINAEKLDGKNDRAYLLVSTSFNRVGTYTATWEVYSTFSSLKSTKTFTFTVPAGSDVELGNGVYALKTFTGTCAQAGQSITISDAALIKDSKITVISETNAKFHLDLNLGSAFTKVNYPCLEQSYSFDVEGPYKITAVSDTNKTLEINYNTGSQGSVKVVFDCFILSNTLKLTIYDDSKNKFVYYFTKQ